MDWVVDGFDKNNGRGEKFGILFSEQISVEEATKFIAGEFGSFRGRETGYLIDDGVYPPCGVVDPKAEPHPDFPVMQVRVFPGSLVYVKPSETWTERWSTEKRTSWDIYEIKEGNMRPGAMKQFMDYLSAK